MSSENYSHTAHYTYIEGALQARWQSFVALEAEMAAFIPRPIADFSDERDKEIARMCELNPSAPVEEMIAFVEHQISFRASHDWQFCSRFDGRHMADYTAVVMVAHALCEALINAVLAIGLAQAKSPELFELIERADFKQKWLIGPKVLAAEYSFPRGVGMHEALIMLARQRNALVHHKIELEIDGTKVLEGSDFVRRPHDEEQRWLRRYFSLPYDLADFLRKALPHTRQMLLFRSGAIVRSPANNAA
jgi:hypothetical protein